MISRKTKKRCPNGSRRDIKTDICVKYDGVKVFKELKDQTISETKTTISFESLEENTILKIYEKGELIEQKLIDEKMIEKGIQKSKNIMGKIMKMVKQIKKNPDKMIELIENDKKFQRFQKKVEREERKKKGGNSRKSFKHSETNYNENSSNTDFLIQENVLNNIQQSKQSELEQKLNELYIDLSKERNKELGEQHGWIGSQIFYSFIALCDIIKYFGEYIIISEAYIASLICDLILIFFPNENIYFLNTIVKFIIYSVLIVIDWSTGGLMLWIQIGIFIINGFKLRKWLNHHASKTEKELYHEIEKTKKKIAETYT
jgi:hypothetical protein